MPAGAFETTQRYRLALRGDAQIGDLAPRDLLFATKRSMVRRRHGVAGKVVEAGDLIMDGDEALEVRADVNCIMILLRGRVGDVHSLRGC